ncbi:MAG: hypothetical protein HZC01_02575 [Candidatus Kerfeldbacteria bacterium]|nr:hypothetical protein [Candidatus Kerfeldbacteria bacterium]
MKNQKGVAKAPLIMIGLIVLILIAVGAWVLTQDKTDNNALNTNTAVGRNENVNTANANENINTTTNSNQTTTENPYEGVDIALNAYDMNTIKTGDKVGVMTAQTIGTDASGNFTAQFTGEATMTGYVSYDPEQIGATCDGVNMYISATSGEVLPREKNVGQPESICFTNTAEAVAAFEPFDPYAPANNRVVVVIDEYFDTLSGNGPTARFVRKSTYDEIASWDTYTNTDLGFTLKFPASWDGYTVNNASATSVVFTRPQIINNEGDADEASFTVLRFAQGSIRPDDTVLINTYGNYDFAYKMNTGESLDDETYWWNLIRDIINTFQYSQ